MIGERAQKAWGALRAALPGWWDLHVYGGLALVSWGVGSVWAPGGLIVLGASLSGLGLWFTTRTAGKGG